MFKERCSAESWINELFQERDPGQRYDLGVVSKRWIIEAMGATEDT